MARKKLKLIGKTTSRKATEAEMTRHKTDVESSIQKGEVTRKEAESGGHKSERKSNSRENEPIVLNKQGVTTGTGETSSEIAPQEKNKSLLKSTVDILSGKTLEDAAIKAGGTLETGSLPIGFGSGTVMVRATQGKWGRGVNLKSFELAKGILKKVFSAKTMGILGGAAGSIFLGLWGQAESGEPLSIIMRDTLKEAEKTGNWDLYNEASEARKEIIDINKWEKLLLYSPISPLIGIPNKLKGIKEAAEIQDRLASDIQIQQETGETEDEKWARIKEDVAQADRDYIDYYNDERKKMVQWEQEAKTNQRTDEAAFWRKERANQSALEAKDREATAKFWLEYRKEAQKLADNNRPSNLNFGFI